MLTYYIAISKHCQYLGTYFLMIILASIDKLKFICYDNYYRGLRIYMNTEAESRASKGGKARAEALNSKKRKEIAQKGALVRWNQVREVSNTEPFAIHPYTKISALKIGAMLLPCAVLENRTPVIFYASVTKTLGRGMGGKGRKLAKKSGGNMPDFLYGTALEPFVSPSLRIALNNPILVRSKGGIRKALDAKLIPEICEVWIDANKANALQKRQEHIAVNAEILLRGFARVGITALVYEATEYEKIKDRDDLEKILEAYISKELLPWTKRFPDGFYQHLFRLRGWQYRPISVKRPKYVGKLTNELVYEKLPQGVLDELRSKNPVTPKGYRKHKFFQFLTEDIGNPHLEKQLVAVMTLMKVAPNWATFYRLFNRAYSQQGEFYFKELEEQNPIP